MEKKIQKIIDYLQKVLKLEDYTITFEFTDDCLEGSMKPRFKRDDDKNTTCFILERRTAEDVFSSKTTTRGPEGYIDFLISHFCMPGLGFTVSNGLIELLKVTKEYSKIMKKV